MKLDLEITGIGTAEEILQGPHKFTALVTVLDPGVPHLTGSEAVPKRLRIRTYDDPEPQSHYAPTKEHVRSLVDFAKTLEPTDKVLVCCMSGISRSTASAWILLSACEAFQDLGGALDHVLEVQPEAWPNRAMLVHADEMFGTLFLKTLQDRDRL